VLSLTSEKQRGEHEGAALSRALDDLRASSLRRTQDLEGQLVEVQVRTPR